MDEEVVDVRLRYAELAGVELWLSGAAAELDDTELAEV